LSISATHKKGKLSVDTNIDASEASRILTAQKKHKPGNPGRSAVTNGKKLLPINDLRGATFRRYRDVYQAVCVDLGGVDMLSEGEKQLARRVATLSAKAELLESQWVTDESKFDVASYCTLVNCLRRVLETIGLKRQMRDITPPSLSAYLASRDTPAKDAQQPE
jgi:hypothetical protein